MVFLQDEGSVFEAPIDVVWEFVGSGNRHSEAHGHRAVKRQRLADPSGVYSWEQPFDGAPTRFTMRWTSFPPVGIAYEVLEGPFTGSKFLLYYTPMGRRTGVTVVGEFVSPSLPDGQVETAVRRFFATEFDQDRAAIEGHRP